MDVPRGGSCCPLFPVRIGIRMIVLMEGGKAEDPKKNPRSKGENQQQTRPTCDTTSENRTRAGWLEASALTTASNIFPNNNDNDTNNNDDMVIMIKTTMTILMKIIIIIDKKIKTIKNIFETNNHNDLDTYTWFHWTAELIDRLLVK